MKSGLKIITIFLLILCQFVYGNDFCEQQSKSKIPTDFAEYMDNVNKKLKDNWNPPDFMEECHIRIIFKLNRKGELISGDLVESSNNPFYDESAIEAIEKSSPFGEFPINSERETLTINYSFDTSFVKTEQMKEYYEQAKKYTYSDRKKALEYINLAIAEVEGDDNAYFLYKRRSKIKEGLGDHLGAKDDNATYEKLKKKVDIKRIHALKHQAETEDTAFAYYYLAYAYEQLEDYDNAIYAIDRAIERTDLNNLYKRYREDLIKNKNKNKKIAP